MGIRSEKGTVALADLSGFARAKAVIGVNYEQDICR
jgi:hypothetical protein